MKNYLFWLPILIRDAWDSIPYVKAYNARRLRKKVREFCDLPVPFGYEEMKALSEKYLAL